MPINSRAKGARFERKFRDELREVGFCAYRGQQFSGLKGNADVVCENLPTIHWEVKGTEAKCFLDWLSQAERDASGGGILPHKTPVVAHKRKGRDWIAILPLKDLLEIIRRSDLVKPTTEMRQQ